MPAVVISSGRGGNDFEGKITSYVVLCGIIAATGGLMFGYDIGISGGVTSMDDFLAEFFHSVYVRKNEAKENNYCKYDNQGLQLFTSSLYLAALVASFFASRTCTKFGRKLTMQVASIFFILGTLLNGAAMNLAMLIVGRILLGMGIGFGNQAVPLFLSEIAPVRVRGGLNILFQLNVTIGILIANLVNYMTSNIHPWGWRLSLGLAAVPAVILFLGSLIITETPTSLIEREKKDEGLAVLKKIRGTERVELEFQEIVHACDMARRHAKDGSYRALMKRGSRPQLVIAILMQVFQQFTGINAIMFYAPVLFQTVGFKSDGSLLSAVITGGVNCLSTVVSIVLVDRVGRRVMLLQACCQMLISQVAIGILLQLHLKDNNSLSPDVSIWVVILVCVFVSSFAWSWGPLGWLIPSETFPIETRTAGFAFAVSSNMFFTFVIAQAFLSMLCHMRAGIFFFFGAWIVLMALFVLFLLPETKNIPIDEMVDRVWKQHWLWKSYMGDDDDDDDHQDTKNKA